MPHIEDGHRLPFCPSLYGNCVLEDMLSPTGKVKMCKKFVYFLHIYISKAWPGVHSPGMWIGDVAPLET